MSARLPSLPILDVKDTCSTFGPLRLKNLTSLQYAELVIVQSVGNIRMSLKWVRTSQRKAPLAAILSRRF